MSSFEFNKIAAAILIAGIIALFSSILAKYIMHVEPLENPSYSLASEEKELNQPDKALGPEPIIALLASADVKSGEKIFKKCMQCHTPEKGGPQRVGPNLWNIVNHTIGKKEGYKYSSAMEAKEGQWAYENLNLYLYKPRDYIKGTKMTFVGLKKTQDRADIIAYLRTLCDNPAPLPNPS